MIFIKRFLRRGGVAWRGVAWRDVALMWYGKLGPVFCVIVALLPTLVTRIAFAETERPTIYIQYIQAAAPPPPEVYVYRKYQLSESSHLVS